MASATVSKSNQGANRKFKVYYSDLVKQSRQLTRSKKETILTSAIESAQEY